MRFVCRLGTPDGRIVEEVHESSEASRLRLTLEGRGFHVFSMRAQGLALRFSPKWFRRRVSNRDFMVFNRELASLLKAGLPLLQSLDLTLERSKPGRLTTILHEVRDNVRRGEDLSRAFAHFDDTFPPLYSASLRAGERSGELESVIRRFIRYLELILQARRKVISAIVYPLVLIGLSVVMVSIMSLFVIPQFEDFYRALDIELPALTKGVLAVSIFVRSHVLAILVSLAVAWFLVLRWARSPGGGLMLDRWQLSVPIVGRIIHLFAQSEFSRSLSTLLSGGIPLVQALEVAVRAVGNRWVRHRLGSVGPQVSQGRSFNEALLETGVFSDLGVDMVKVGESTGALDVMLDDVADFFDQEAEAKLERFLILLEPIMLVIMGIVIAVLLAAMYLPMFSAWEQIQ